MLSTFHYIFSLPRGWLCYTLITSQRRGGKHWSNAHHRSLSWKLAFNKNLQAPFLLCLCRHFCAHSADDSFRPVKITRACKECALLAVRDKNKTQHPPLHPQTLCPPLTFKTTFQHHGQLHKGAPLMSKFEVSLEQCPCFGAQRDTLLLCNNTHILIDCVPNNYSVKERHYIKL